MSFRVFIGVGHGGSDSGANSYVREKDANLVIALELKKQLEAAGIEVGISRTVDEDDPVSEEVQEANAFKPDLAVEVHNNAAGGDGFEVYVQTNQYAAKSRAAAQAIEAEVKAMGQNSRGIKTKGFWWTNGVKAPAVLLEGFFVDNWNDAQDFDTVEEQQALGRAYARGVLKYFGIDSDVQPEPAEPVKETYTVTVVGHFDSESAAEEALEKAVALGFTGTIAKETDKPKEMTIGSTVRMKEYTKYYDGKTPKDFVYRRDHKVHSMAGNRVVISYNNTIIGAVHKENLILVE